MKKTRQAVRGTKGKPKLAKVLAQVEQAEARIEQVRAREEQAKAREEQAKAKAEQAKAREEQARAQAERATTRAEVAEQGLKRVLQREPIETRAIELPRLLTSPSASSPADSKSSLHQLTERQQEILRLIAEGKNTKQIAELLKVSPKTVEYHRMKLMAGLKLHDIPGLVRFALKAGLVAPDS